jgi:hypothetical protein
MREMMMMTYYVTCAMIYIKIISLLIIDTSASKMSQIWDTHIW